jgi:hypothetical protein
MSPVKTVKVDRAIDTLVFLGLVPSAVNALIQSGPDALYAELSRRGYVWSTDLAKWRKSKKTRRPAATVIRTGYLDAVIVRLVVREVHTEEAITEFSSIMAQFGYGVQRVSVHSGRNEGEVLIYFALRQGEPSND